jgi:hypothetical protein
MMKAARQSRFSLTAPPAIMPPATTPKALPMGMPNE